MDSVYNFWFGENANTYSENYKLNTKLWFRASAAIDADISSKFRELMEAVAQNPIWDNARNSLCTLILLDQFSRHIHRGTADAFKYDSLALQVAEKIISEGWIDALSPVESLFVYFTFMHQESTQHVKRSITGLQNASLFANPRHTKVIQNFRASACRHLEILDRFQRYPHRNEALQRPSTAEELEFLNSHGSSLFMKSQRPRSQNSSRIPAKYETSSTSSSRFKILCLHGWRQNGRVFRMRCKKMIRELRDIADFHFPTSPTSYEPEGDQLEATLAAYETIPNYSNQCVWWISSENNEYYQHVDTSLAFLQQVWEREGPFDGVLGFAQGGTMASILDYKGFSPQFLILISSYVPRALEFKSMNQERLLKTPSIHILGLEDILVVPDRSRKLSQIFENSVLIEHSAGHFTPKNWPYPEMRQFISKFKPRSSTISSIIDDDYWERLILSTNSDNVTEIAQIVSEQLKQDLAVGYNIQRTYCKRSENSTNKSMDKCCEDKFHFDQPLNPLDAMCPSKCVDAMIGRRHSLNKRYHLSKLVAANIFTQLDELRQLACLNKALKILRNMRQRTHPDFNDKIVNHYSEARASENRRKALENVPLSHHITRPKPEPVTVCPLEDLQPLLEFLSRNPTVSHQMQFSRGTITLDGSLDLCKQVVGPGGIGPVLNAMNKASHVKRLLLGNNIVGNSGAQKIAAEILASNLECWYIAGNEFTCEGLTPIAESFKHNICCTSLYLKRNPLGPSSMKPLSDMLQVNHRIEILDLDNCGILDEGLETLLKAFGGTNCNTTLRVLWLSTNGITQKSAPLIADYISQSCMLTDLALSCNRVCDSGIEMIAQALAKNHTLQRLSFASNRIGPLGARYLSEALQNHPTIRFLNLGYSRSTDAVHELGNSLSDEGAVYMADLIRHNTVLRNLDLLHNSISQAGVNSIISALEHNTSLVKLQLTQFGKVHNEPGKEYIKAKLADNYAALTPDERTLADEASMPTYVRDIYSVYRTKF